MATTTRTKWRKLESLVIEKQQLSEIQNDIIDSQDSEDEEYIPSSSSNGENSEQSEESKSNCSEPFNHLLIVDNIGNEEEKLESKKRQRVVQKQKKCWVWQFFTGPENEYVTCQVANCKMRLKYCNTPASMKTHLTGVHRITESSLKKNSVDELKKDQLSGQLTLHQTYEVIQPYPQQKTKQLHKSLTQFVIGTV